MDNFFKKLMLVLTVVCLALTCATGVVLAQNFKEGTAYVEPRGGVYGATGNKVNLMVTYGGAFGYYVLHNVALEVEGLGYYVDQQRLTNTAMGTSSKDDQTTGGGVNAIAKWHFVNTPQVSMFLGAGGGGVWTADKIAYNGSKNNWTGLGEVGMTFAVTQSFGVKAAGRYQHIGSFDNTGVNALGGNLGLMFTF